MKHTICCFILAFIAFSISAQPTYTWADAAKGNSTESVNSSFTDAAGNTYITGYFRSDTMVLGAKKLVNDLHDVSFRWQYESAMFVAKYNAAGGLEWAHCSQTAARGLDVTVDGDGNVFVTGIYEIDSIACDGLSASGSVYSGGNMFLARYNAGGAIQWIKVAGSVGTPDYGVAASCDAAGNIYVLCNFFGGVFHFAGTSVSHGGNNFSASGVANMLLLKYDAAGTPCWVKRPICPGGAAAGYDMTLDAAGNILVSGYFTHGDAVFDSDTLALSSGDGYDLFVAKYNSAGDVLWAVSSGDSSYHYFSPEAIAADASGNVFIAGSFGGDTLQLGGEMFIDKGSSDVFIAKLNGNTGAILWAKPAGSIGLDRATSMVPDANGHVFISGYFDCNSGAIVFDNDTLAGSGTYDGFIAAYDAATGNALWGVKIGGPGDEQIQGLSIDGQGNMYVTGDYEYASLQLGTATLTTWGLGDVFIARLGSPTNIAGITNEIAIVVYPNPTTGSVIVATDEICTEIIVHDITGRLIERIIPEAKRVMFSIPSSGLYFIEAVVGDKRVTRKLIVR